MRKSPLLLLFVLFVSACPRSSKAVDPSPKPTTSSPVEKNVEEKKKVEKKGPTKCVIDDQCETYYRCIKSLCAIPPAITGVKDDNTPTAVFNLTNKKVTINLELAISGKEMMRGLMYRKTMKKDWGMLFIYDDVRVRSFWMKNTIMPLDMIFIDQYGVIVGVIVGAEPMTLKSRSVGIPSKYVLELKAGRSIELALSKGVQLNTLSHVEEWQQIQVPPN